jgi:predicted transcriptional regulator
VRTTIELKPELRARLVELAARRGEKGISSVIAEAVEVYLAGSTEQERFRKRALRLRGTLPHDEARRLQQSSGTPRQFWR